METNTIDRYEYDENATSRRQKSKSCNSKICFAYLLSVIASGVIVSGVYLSYIRWDKIWLILSFLGIILILIGSCFYYSGNVDLFHANEEQVFENRPRRRRRYRNRGLSTDQLMPSAPPLSQSRSVSQFSLNMIPQYFSSIESEAIQSNATNTPPVSQLKTFSQIFSVNGQSYLILPLSGEPLPASNNNSFPLQNIVLKVSEDNQIKTSKNIETCNEMSSESESKKINREEQSSQTDDFPKEIRKSNNCFRDVQLQTLTRTQLEQTSNEVTNIPTESPQSSGRIESTNVQNLNRTECNSIVEIIPSAGPSHLHSSESQAYSFESYESNYSSADTESDHLDSEIVNNISLIDFNDNNNACTSSEFICRANDNFDQNEQNCSQNLLNSSINENSIRNEDYVESECFNNFSNENVNEDEVDDSLSTPPPSYEEVIDVNEDHNNEETPIIVNYGTL